MKTNRYKHTLLLLLLAALWGSGKAQQIPYEETPWGKRGITQMQWGLEQKDAKYVFMARFLEDTCIWYDQNIYTVYLVEVIGVFRGDIKLGKLQIAHWGGNIGNSYATSTAGEPYRMNNGATAVFIARDFLPEQSVYDSLSNKGVLQWLSFQVPAFTLYTPSMNQAGKMLDFYSDFSLRRVDTAWAADSARLAREAGTQGKQKKEEERRRAEAERVRKEKQRRTNERINRHILELELERRRRDSLERASEKKLKGHRAKTDTTFTLTMENHRIKRTLSGNYYEFDIYLKTDADYGDLYLWEAIAYVKYDTT